MKFSWARKEMKRIYSDLEVLEGGKISRFKEEDIWTWNAVGMALEIQKMVVEKWDTRRDYSLCS